MSLYLSEWGERRDGGRGGCLMLRQGGGGVRRVWVWGGVGGGPLGLCQTAGCHVFFPQIHNGEQKAYVLKNKELTGPTKGVIFLEADVIFNSVSPPHSAPPRHCVVH